MFDSDDMRNAPPNFQCAFTRVTYTDEIFVYIQSKHVLLRINCLYREGKRVGGVKILSSRGLSLSHECWTNSNLESLHLLDRQKILLQF